MIVNNEHLLMPCDPYPLRLEPAFRDYQWGGRKLATRLGKRLPADGIWAESWEVVDHPEHESVIANGELAGKTLGAVMRSQTDWLVGETPTINGRFPLLLKYLDCMRVLSVQVHPDDNYARLLQPPDLGKTEAWYIVDSEPGAVLYSGLKPGVDAQSLRAAIAAGKTVECLHQIKPREGDCIFIPAGTVHALGAGLIVAEIQQASNTTFRLYDWDRVDKDGKSRPLHIDRSLETIDFAAGPRERQEPIATDQPGRVRLVDCDKFCFARISDVAQSSIGGDGQFHILTVPRGQVVVRCNGGWESLRTGESLLLPASLGECQLELEPDTILLEATMP